MDFQRLIDAKNGWVGLMTSRGCPFSCTYCFNHVMVNTYKHELQCSFKEINYIRRFPVEQVIDEIKYLQDHYRNITTYIFDDDIFTFDKSYVEDFCRAYKKVTDVPFVVNAHVGFFDERRARLLAEANCRIIKFGIESGSPKIRGSILNRHMTNESIVQAIKTVRDFKMHSSIFLIIGFPHETSDDVYETIKLTAKALPGRFRWTFFFPFPGTKAYQISEEGHFIDFEKMERLKNFTDECCLDFGPGQNLLLKKIGRIMPWFVNAHSDLPVAGFYREQIHKLLDMDDTRWQEVSPALYEKDKEYSRQFSQQGLSHYAIKYNRFMGVISDYFLNE
jgi:tRNA A37 methylthiotransferase MiaB